MAGIYVHIPFCASRCSYCGFFSTVSLGERQRYVEAVCRELELRRGEIKEAVRTVYIGGGTPSQLTGEQLSRLVEALPLEEALEVTVECNPDDVAAEGTAALPQFTRTLGKLSAPAGHGPSTRPKRSEGEGEGPGAGPKRSEDEGAGPGAGGKRGWVNRVSMGVQTFSDERLRAIGRRHSAAQARRAVELVRRAGIGNVSIDLMYGFPGETVAEWRRDVEEALALGVEHVSAYCLTMEEGTALYRQREAGLVSETDEETARAMYEVLADRLTAAGYEHYELSNFARPGFRSMHNSGYWRQVPYVGLGAAAHSFDGRDRQWNVSSLGEYMAAVERGVVPCEVERLTAAERYNDVVMTALRTREGLPLDVLTREEERYCLGEAAPFLADGLLRQEGRWLRLTRKGLFVSDMVMSGLMMV